MESEPPSVASNCETEDDDYNVSSTAFSSSEEELNNTADLSSCDKGGTSFSSKKSQYHDLRPQKDTSYKDDLVSSEDEEVTKQKISRAEYMRIYRKNMSPAQLVKYRAKSNERMKRYRERRKATHPEKEILTRKAKQDQREHWKCAKRLQRSNMSPSKKEAYLRKRREAYQRKKKSRKEKNLKIFLHQSPSKFAEQIDQLVSSATPKKKDALEKRGFFVDNEAKTNQKAVANLKIRMKTLKKSKNSRDRQKYRNLVSSVSGHDSVDEVLRRKLEVRYDTWKLYTSLDPDSCQRKKRSDSMSDENQLEIQQFYINHATIVNNKNLHSKEGQPKHVLNMTTNKLHKTYSTVIGKKISLSKFRKMRPGFVVTVKNHRFNNCLCEYCVNIEEKLKVLNIEANKINSDLPKINSKFDLINLTLCPIESGKFHKKICTKRLCKDCGPKLLSKTFKPLIEDLGEKEVKWSIWMTEKFVNKDKDKEDTMDAEKVTSKKVLHDKIGTMNDLIEELEKEAGPFAGHIFNAQWQRSQLQDLKTNLPDSWILCIEDYAENFRSKFQDEIQAAFYMYQLVTVFPIVAYYKCSKCDHQVEHSSVVITDDLRHDAEAVNHMERLFDDHLGQTFEKKIVYSDGCASQFKSKIPFQFVAKSPELHRAYFGTRHGKSPCDALGGIIKNAATRHIAARQGQWN